MALKTLALLAIAAGTAAAVYRRAQPALAVASRTDRNVPGADEASSSGTAMSNPGERLQELGRVDLSPGARAVTESGDVLSPAREGTQDDDIKPGLPDYLRGA